MKCQPNQHQWTDWYTVKSLKKKEEWQRRHCPVCGEIQDTAHVKTVQIVQIGQTVER